MKDKCSACYSHFDETPIQFHQRMKKSTPKICRDCNRINQAEMRAIEREKDRENPEFVLLQRLMNKHGKVSTTQVQIKLRLDQEAANELIYKFMHTCPR